MFFVLPKMAFPSLHLLGDHILGVLAFGSRFRALRSQAQASHCRLRASA